MRRVKYLRQKRMPTFRLVFCEFTHDCGWEKTGEFCRGWQTRVPAAAAEALYTIH